MAFNPGVTNVRVGTRGGGNPHSGRTHVGSRTHTHRGGGHVPWGVGYSSSPIRVGTSGRAYSRHQHTSYRSSFHFNPFPAIRHVFGVNRLYYVVTDHREYRHVSVPSALTDAIFNIAFRAGIITLALGFLFASGAAVSLGATMAGVGLIGLIAYNILN